MVSPAALSPGLRQALKVSLPHDLAANMALIVLFLRPSRTTMAACLTPNHRLNWWCPELYDNLWAALSGLAVNFGYLAILPIWREKAWIFVVFSICHGQLWSAALHSAIN